MAAAAVAAAPDADAVLGSAVLLLRATRPPAINLQVLTWNVSRFSVEELFSSARIHQPELLSTRHLAAAALTSTTPAVSRLLPKLLRRGVHHVDLMSA